jgi:tripartite-type tricarboxylate transporter receptor subunit TctC
MAPSASGVVMRITAAAIAILSALMAGVAPGQADTYPSRLIKMIVPFPVGGGADVLVRVLTQRMGEDLGQQFVVVNQPGASGALAFEQVAHAAPDGYTLTWTSTAFPVMAATMPNLEFNPATDFTHIAHVAENPFILVVNPQVPVHSVGELVALAKAKPNSLNFAHNGPGTLTRLTLSLLQQRTGIEVGNISYRGDNFSIADVISGQVQGMFSNSPVALPRLTSGQVRGLAVTSAKRSAAAPDLPTMAEAGVPDFQVVVWHGLSGPAGLPRPIVDRLNASLNKAIADPQILAQLKTLGVEPVGGTPEEFQSVMTKELSFWADVAKQADKANN